MSDTIWITTKYPEPFKNVLAYDIHDGYIVAYYDNIMNMFYDARSNISMPFVTAWQPLPKVPLSAQPLKNGISSKYIPRVEVTPKPKKDNV